jgi:FkbM family methyltransferase
MIQRLINNLLKPFNAEIHGKGYLKALAKGEFKVDAFKVQQQHFNKNDVKVIFDIGANRGQVVQYYLDLFPNATIHAFEPFQESFNILKANFENNKRVVLNQIAISNHENDVEFFVNVNADTNSLLKPQETGLSSDKQVKNLEKITVPCSTIDAYCKKHQISNIDILKMDIQGGEYNALLGAFEKLESKKIDLVYTESFFVEQYEKAPLFFDIGKLMHQNGYCLQDIYAPNYGNNKIAWCDAIFIKK